MAPFLNAVVLRAPANLARSGEARPAVTVILALLIKVQILSPLTSPPQQNDSLVVLGTMNDPSPKLVDRFPAVLNKLTAVQIDPLQFLPLRRA